MRNIPCSGDDTGKKNPAHSLMKLFYHESINRTSTPSDVKTIPDTRKIHSIRNMGTEGVLKMRNMMCCCPYDLHGTSTCLFKEYTDQWTLCSVLGHKKAELKQIKNTLHCKPAESNTESTKTATNTIMQTMKTGPDVMKIIVQNTNTNLNPVMQTDDSIMNSDCSVMNT